MKTSKSPETELKEILPHLIGIWRRYIGESGPGDKLQTREFRRVVEGVKTLKNGLEMNGSLLGEDYFQKRDLLGSYLLYFWVIHYLEAFSLIEELPNKPKRVLDICAGPIPMGFAALRHGADEVFATDRNQEALQLGAEVAGRYGLPMNIRNWNCLRGPLPVEGKFDLIILGYALEELFPSNQKDWKENQHHFLKMLLNRLTPQGNLLLVDSSFGAFNTRILECRDRLVKEGIPIQAPCVWRGECPALKVQNSPCYAQREFEKPYFIKEIQRAADINLSSLKMSYLITRSPESPWPSLPPKPLYRVISPPVESHLGKSFYLCGTDGKKKLSSQNKTHSKEARAFDYLRRGELISVEHALESKLNLEIRDNTIVKMEAACGKPLPEVFDEESTDGYNNRE